MIALEVLLIKEASERFLERCKTCSHAEGNRCHYTCPSLTGQTATAAALSTMDGEAQWRPRARNYAARVAKGIPEGYHIVTNSWQATWCQLDVPCSAWEQAHTNSATI